ncbi:MAG: hypothetical protein IPP55_08930 [Anaerolineales bacterium]|nr:hypothetical protein [Anaerolineales bacterium]
MMQEKRIVGALQAEQNAKAQVAKAELIAKNEDRAPIDIAKVNQIMQAQSNREKLIAKNEDRAPIDMKKVEQLVQQSVEANRWAGVASVAQAKQETEKKNTGGVKALATPIRTDDPPTWWEKVEQTWEDIKLWTNDHIVQPVKDTYTKIVTTVKKFVINTAIAIQNKYEDTKKAIIQKWEDTKTWVNDHVVQPVKNTVTKVVTTVKNEYQQYDTWKTIRNEYGWTPIGNFSQKELAYIADTGNNIETKIDVINGGYGSDWMDRYMSDVLIMKWSTFFKMDQPWTLPLPKILSPFGKSIILLPQNWENSYEKIYEKDPKIMPLTHEFGHVWDIATGHVDFRAVLISLINNKPIIGIVNGAADDLNTFIGGDIVQLNSTRMTANTGRDRIPDAYEWINGFNKDYGNNSTADYFAEGFDALINDPGTIPTSDVKQWFVDVINDETLRLP